MQGDWLFICVKCLCFVPAVGIQRRARQVKLGYGTKQAESPCAHSLSSQLPFVRDELVPCIFFARRIHPSCRPSLCKRALCLDQGRRRRGGGGRKERNDLCSESCPTWGERPATCNSHGWWVAFRTGLENRGSSPEWPPKTNLTWHANDMRQAGERGWKEGGPVLQQPSSQERGDITSQSE